MVYEVFLCFIGVLVMIGNFIRGSVDVWVKEWKKFKRN